MGNSVYANGMGFFHKGSGGTGVAQVDVCSTPPPPPKPVPYVVVAKASDLSKGSKSVKIEGNPTALHGVSAVATCTGDEPATTAQGAGVVSHKIKGLSEFKLCSHDAKVEGKGVCRHGDLTCQNEQDTLPNCVAIQATVNFANMLAEKGWNKPCGKKRKYKQSCRPKRTSEQANAVNGKPCWECARDFGETEARYYVKMANLGKGKGAFHRTRDEGTNKEVDRYMTHDHQPPLKTAWEMGGCHMEKSPEAFLEHFSTAESVLPHCRAHAKSQGGRVNGHTNRWMKRRK